MSIATKTGDAGETGLMFGKRVSKTDPRVKVCGTIDELNSHLGMVRATGQNIWEGEQVLLIQKDLIGLMGEIALLEEDRARYIEAGYATLEKDALGRLDAGVKKIEDQKPPFDGWATPGATLHAATLDVARTVCRRAEREIVAMQRSGLYVSPLVLKYLNRLSDFLWLLARLEENAAKK